MDRINFHEEFEKVARRRGMGPAISSGVICHKAREILKEVFADGGGEVVSFKDGLLTICFGSSGALFSFGTKKEKFLGKLNSTLKKNQVDEVKAIMRRISLD